MSLTIIPIPQSSIHLLPHRYKTGALLAVDIKELVQKAEKASFTVRVLFCSVLFCSVLWLFLSFLVCVVSLSLSLSDSYPSIAARLPSLTPHGTSLTIIPLPQSNNQSINRRNTNLLSPCRYYSSPRVAAR
jgi:hypothetical protein